MKFSGQILTFIALSGYLVSIFSFASLCEAQVNFKADKIPHFESSQFARKYTRSKSISCNKIFAEYDRYVTDVTQQNLFENIEFLRVRLNHSFCTDLFHGEEFGVKGAFDWLLIVENSKIGYQNNQLYWDALSYTCLNQKDFAVAYWSCFKLRTQPEKFHFGDMKSPRRPESYLSGKATIALESYTRAAKAKNQR